MVAARRLRKSMLKDLPNVNLDNITNISEANYKKKNKIEKFKDSIEEDIYLKDNLGTFEEIKPKLKLKTKYIFKIFLCISIVFSCLIIKLFFKEQVLNNKYIGYLIHEYNKDYTKVGVIEKIEDIVNDGYQKLKYIIPESLAIKVKENYINNVKQKLIKFEVKDVISKIFTTTNTINETNADKNKEISENTGVGGGDVEVQTMEIPSEEEIVVRERIFKILDKKIDIKKPVEGVLTSKYGEREKIFEELSKYHTGLDIANKLGTEIKSATKGKVVKVEENNKYYGNNIEIETDGVIFKYAHLNGFNVKLSDEVTQDSIIGYMGSTGMSTGSHLHFEIRIDNKTVDPNEIIKYY